MATRKKKAKAKVTKKPRVKAKKPTRKATKKRRVSPLPDPLPRQGRGRQFEEASTQQIAVAEIIGDIEERMALDRIGP